MREGEKYTKIGQKEEEEGRKKKRETREKRKRREQCEGGRKVRFASSAP